MVKIYIDPGHGGIDSGATGNGLLEKNVTLQIALAVRKYLGEYQGVSIKMSRTTDKTVTLNERTKEANSWGADYFLSIHINAGGGTGFESYIYKGISSTSSTGKKRTIIHKKVLAVNGLRDRGQKQGNLHVLRESKMSSVLTENGFIDTTADANKMKDKAWIDRVGKAHAEGIADIYNLKKNAPASNSTTSKPTPTNETYKVNKNTSGYMTAVDAKNKKNQKSTVLAGAYYIYKKSGGMLNVTKQKGVPGSWINPNATTITKPTTFKVGDHVVVKNSAKTYATGEKIPSWVKNKSLTVQQVASDRVLLKEITSWVKKTDVSKK